MRSKTERLSALGPVLSARSCPLGATDLDWTDSCGLVAGDSTDGAGRTGLVMVPLSSRDLEDVENRCDPELAGVLSGTAGGAVVPEAPGALRKSGSAGLGVGLADCRWLVIRSMTDLRVLSLLADGADDEGGVARLLVLGVSIRVPNRLVPAVLDVFGWAGVVLDEEMSNPNCREFAALPKLPRLGAGALMGGADGAVGAGLLTLGEGLEGTVIDGLLALGAGMERVIPDGALGRTDGLEGATTGGLLGLTDGLDGEGEDGRGALMEGLGARDGPGAGLGLAAARRSAICCKTALRLDPPCACATTAGRKAPSEKPL
jgi:hypothetical protein